MNLNQGCNSLIPTPTPTHTPTPTPLSFQDCYNNGLSLIKQGKYEKALSFLNKALEIEPDNLQALNDKGSALYYQKNYKEAIKCYNKILGISGETGQMLRG